MWNTLILNTVEQVCSVWMFLSSPGQWKWCPPSPPQATQANCAGRLDDHIWWWPPQLYRWSVYRCRIYRECAGWGVCVCGHPVWRAASWARLVSELQSPPFSVHFFCLCDKVYHKQERRFLMHFIIYYNHNPNPMALNWPCTIINDHDW